MPACQRAVKLCLFLIAAIALFGGSLQVTLGQPVATPRLDNVYRYMEGVYPLMGSIGFSAAWPFRQQDTLCHLIAPGIVIAAIGRIISITKVGLPERGTLWIGYLIPMALAIALPFVKASPYRASLAQRTGA
jgi:hypothetical protein